MVTCNKTLFFILTLYKMPPLCVVLLFQQNMFFLIARLYYARKQFSFSTNSTIILACFATEESAPARLLKQLILQLWVLVDMIN